MSESTERANNGKIFRAFITASREHWKQLIGGSFVAILIGVALTMGLSIPRSVSGLIALCLAVLLACFLAFRDQYRKAERLEELMKSKIHVTCGRNDPMSVFTVLSRGDTYFRARMELIGMEPIRKIKAAITAVRKDGENLPLYEAARLTFHPGVPILPELCAGTPEFLDVMRVEEDGRLALMLIGTYPAVDTYMCAEAAHVYELDVSITGPTPSQKCTFVFDWTGNRDTADFHLRQIHMPPRLG